MAALQLLSERQSCGARCHLAAHARALASATSKCASAEQWRSYAPLLCRNFWRAKDAAGRSAPHWAAATGRADLLDWLLGVVGADAAVKDSESGYTPLHVALLYGRVTCAQILLDHGASTTALDREGLTPFELVLKDRCRDGRLSFSDRTEVYTAGENASFTLGHAHPHPRTVVEPVDMFRRQSLCVKKVAMDKFHSLFLTTSGGAFACGHGVGGRLALGDESSRFCPEYVKLPSESRIIDIAAGSDHSLFVCQNAKLLVFASGNNSRGQLGLDKSVDKSLSPHSVFSSKSTEEFVGCAASALHSLVWTRDRQVFVFGANDGQLGLDAGDRSIFTPTKLTRIDSRAIGDSGGGDEAAAAQTLLVATTDTASVLVTPRGDVLLLRAFGRARIAAKQLGLRHVCMQTQPTLTVLALRADGRLLGWTDRDPVLRPCVFAGGVARPRLAAVELNRKGLVAVTADGTALKATLGERSAKSGDGRAVVISGRVAAVHRAIALATDAAAANSAFIQGSPSIAVTDLPVVQPGTLASDLNSLLTDASRNVSDLTVHLAHCVFQVHRFVLFSRSPRLATEIGDKPEWNVPADQLTSFIMEQYLLYVYTGSCDLLTVGKRWGNGAHDPQSKKRPKKGSKQKLKSDKPMPTKEGRENPIAQLQRMARRYGPDELVKDLQSVEWLPAGNGAVDAGSVRRRAHHAEPRRRHCFDATALPSLFDVRIKCADGVDISAHRCILAARLEFFRCMFCSSWKETNDVDETVNLPLASPIARILLHYLYTDDVPPSVRRATSPSEVPETLCHLLVAADQLLVDRLRHLCEASLASLVSLRNAAELLLFAQTFNACQLKATCLQFVSVNLVTLLENGALQSLDRPSLDAIGSYYRRHFGHVGERQLTPSADEPSIEALQLCEAQVESAGVALDELTSAALALHRAELSASAAHSHRSPSAKMTSTLTAETPLSPSTPCSTETAPETEAARPPARRAPESAQVDETNATEQRQSPRTRVISLLDSPNRFRPQ